jgi:hypothetical protein
MSDTMRTFDSGQLARDEPRDVEEEMLDDKDGKRQEE